MSLTPGHSRRCVCPDCLASAIENANAAVDGFRAAVLAWWLATWTTVVDDARRFLGLHSPSASSLCEHDSWTGDEGPIVDLGRWPRRWRCDGCGIVKHDDEGDRP